MDRNTLLNSSRAKFLSAFNALIDGVVHRSIARLYDKAEKSPSTQVQRHLLDARTVLVRNETALVEHIIRQLDALLKRSYQTAYDTFRPSFFKSGKASQLALMDINAFEDDLRIDVITGRFRSESEEQLRDLNIRIAILFERNDIAERENPFRPYLLSRAIVLGVETIKAEPEIFVILTDQIAEELLLKVASIYEDVNQYLSDCGVAAQLQFKSQRMPSDLTNPVGYDAESKAEEAVESGLAQQPRQATQQRQYPNPGAAPQAKIGKIEQLINIVKSRNGQQGNAGSPGGGMSNGAPAGSGAFFGNGGTNGAGGGFGPGTNGAGFGNFANGGAGGMGGASGQRGFAGQGGGFGQAGASGSAGGDGHGGASGSGGSDGQDSTFGSGSDGQGSTFGSGGGYGQADPSGTGNGQGSAGGLMNQAASAVTGWLEGAQEVGDTLRKIFFGGGTRAAMQGSAAGEYSSSESAEYQGGPGQAWQGGSGTDQMVGISPQLRHALHSPVPTSTEMVGTDGEVRNLIIERRDSLNSLATDQHEKMTIDIVAMLFEFILKDHQVPAEVRAQLGRLQFSVLKMALMDSALLTKKSHPARMLVNRIGSISVGLQQIDPTGERISAEICRIVEELLAHDSENPELFSKMLDQLDGFIARELLNSNNKVEQAIKVVVHAEQRSQRLNQESARLEKMLEGILITPYLKRFLMDTWSHVIERVERNPGTDSTRFRLLVPNLLWSILPKANRDDRSMLLQIIPIIVPILREGMGLVAWLPEHQQELLNWLVDAHTTVMRSPITEEKVLSLVDIQRHFHEFVYPDAEPLPADTVVDRVDVNRVFLDEAIKELEKELQEVGILQDLDVQPDLVEQDAHYPEQDLSESDVETGVFASNGGPAADYSSQTEADTALLAAPREDDILERLRSGVIVEINLSGSPTKGRLNWISPNSSNLILTVNGQEAPSIISVRMFRRMLKNSRARFVEVAPLFERAVQSLLESADLVDLAHAA